VGERKALSASAAFADSIPEQQELLKLYRHQAADSMTVVFGLEPGATDSFTMRLCLR
jgi:hypothetical protein